MISTSSPNIRDTASLYPEKQRFLYDKVPTHLCKSAAASTGKTTFLDAPKRTSLTYVSFCSDVRNTPTPYPSPSSVSVSEKSDLLVSRVIAQNVEEHRRQRLPYCTSMGNSSDAPLSPTSGTGFWHWLVVFGSFLCLFVVEGLCFSYGLYMQAMMVENQFSPNELSSGDTNLRPSLAALSLPGAIMCGTYLLIGPLTGALVNRFNDRLISGLGAVMSAVSILLSSLFARDLSYFTLLFGFFGGVGCGLIYLPAITVVGQWFHKHRAFIVGLAMCGGGFGAGIMAVAIRPLCKALTWRGALIITSALFIQTLLGIALFRPYSTHQSILAIRRERLRATDICGTREKMKSNTNKKWSFLKKPANRRSGLKCGSIMTRIIEEKNRQRTTSTGSLDGMVITRENEVIALSSTEAYESIAIAAAAYAAMHPVQSSSDPVTSTSHIETDKVPENKVQCTHASGFPGRTALHTLQEEPCSPTNSNQHSCVAVLPPPVRFNRHAVRRIAKALIHKLQMTKVLPRHSSLVIDPGLSRRTFSGYRHSADGKNEVSSTPESLRCQRSMNEQGNIQLDLPEVGEQPSHIHDSRCQTILHVSSTSNTSAEFSRSANDRQSEGLSPIQPTPVDSPNVVSGMASSVSLDPCLNGLIVRELHGLPLDEQTKASILTALRVELNRPKCRPDLFYHGVKTFPLQDHSRFSMKTDDPYGSGYNRFRIAHKTKSGSIQRIARCSSNVVKPSSKSPEEAPLFKRMRVEVESAPPTSCLTGIHVEQDNRMVDTLNYLYDMLDVSILKSITFLILLLTCSINMLVLLVPYYYLPLLLELGGYECSINKLWCPDGLPHRATLQPSWLQHTVRWIAGDYSATFFVSPGFVLLSIGFANVVGRILAALYMEGGEKAKCKLLKPCFFITDPILLKFICFILCGLSLACLPLSIHGVVTSTPRQKRQIPNQTEHVQAWSTEFRLVLLYFSSIIYGGASAFALSLRSVVLVELFGIQRLTNAFGYLLIFQGFSVICGPPVFGSFCDLACHGQFLPDSHSELPSDIKFSNTSTCANRICITFYICAALFVLTGFLLIPLRWFARRESQWSSSASGVAVSSSHPSIKEDAFSAFPPCTPDFPNYDTRDTQTTTVSGACMDPED